VFSETPEGGLGILKGGDASTLFTGEEFIDDPATVVYALTPKGLEVQQGDQTPSSSTSTLWIILVSVLGGVALLSIIAVTITMIVLSKRYGELQKSSQSFMTVGKIDADDGEEAAAALEENTKTQEAFVPETS
jgi:hypothetical protein